MIFKDVIGHQGYTVCSDGFVIGPTATIIKPWKNINGKQYYVQIQENRYNLAKLVCDHFTISELGKNNVLHIDFDIEYNAIRNLKRCTRGDLRRHYNIGKLRGVSRWKSGPYVKWRAYEGDMNNTTTIGYFKTKNEAYLVYQAYFLDKHGYAPF